jgi:hypothetical protein
VVVLRRSVGAAMATSGRYAAAAMSGVLAGGTIDELLSLEAATVASQNRLDAALRQRLAERPSDDPRLVELARLVTAIARIRTTADAEHRLAERIADAPRPRPAAQLLIDAEGLRDWYVAFGDAFSARAEVPRPDAPDPLEHSAMIEAVRHSAAHEPRRNAIAALACAWVGLHIDQLRRLEARVAEAALTLQEPG